MIALAAVLYLVVGIATLRITDSWGITRSARYPGSLIPTSLYLITWPFFWTAVLGVMLGVVVWNSLVWLSGRE